MSGVLWAAVAGVAFGVFQSLNRRALVELDVIGSTFVQLVVCSLFMLVALGIQGTEPLGDVPGSAWANFVVAGLVHFLIGWTLLNASQKRVGAARTSPLLSTSPLFGTTIAAVTLDQSPGGAEVAGILIIVAGVLVAQRERIRAQRARRASVPVGAVASDAPVASDAAGGDPPFDVSMRGSLYGLGAALAVAVSPIYIRNGLDEVDDPVLGVTVGVVAATIAFGVLLLARRGPSLRSASRGALAWKGVAGLLVAAATWTRWYALSRTSVAAVLGLALLSVPTVIVLAPIASGRHLEPITAPVVLGSALVVAGALVLIVQG